MIESEKAIQSFKVRLRRSLESSKGGVREKTVTINNP